MHCSPTREQNVEFILDKTSKKGNALTKCPRPYSKQIFYLVLFAVSEFHSEITLDFMDLTSK